MSTSTSSEHLVCLITHSKDLASLLQRVERQKKEGSNEAQSSQSTHEKVQGIIMELLDAIKKGQRGVFFPKESVDRLLQRVQVTIENFSQLDPHNKSEYENLSKRVKDFNLPNQYSSAATLQGDCSTASKALEYPVNEFSATFEQLRDDEKNCLFCLCLLPDNKDIKIKKRELMHWCIGMDFIQDDLLGHDILDRFVSMGFIERASKYKKFFNRYKLNDSIKKTVKDMMSAFGHIDEEVAPWSVMHQQQQPLQRLPSKQQLQQQQGTPKKEATQRTSFTCMTTLKSQQGDKSLPLALVNINESTLNAKTFEWIYKMKSLKVLHLGSWHHDPTNYILVKDIDLFKDLKNLWQIRFLSFQGISGITKLPDSIYKLDNLVVLDLKACHNLESLPERIHLLTKLTHLDLSDCHLIRQLPAGIKNLSGLQVLKGFVINQNEDSAATNLQEGRPNKKGEKFSSCALFSDVLRLSNLRKLTVRTRRMDFPTNKDLDTLCDMQQLKNLKITWVGSPQDARTDGRLRKFPTTLEKLELQGAPERISTLMLGLIGKQVANRLEKLYIRGGGLRALDTEKCCLALRY